MNFLTTENMILKLHNPPKISIYKILFTTLIFMKFWSRNNLDKLDQLTPQDVYYVVNLATKCMSSPFFTLVYLLTSSWLVNRRLTYFSNLCRSTHSHQVPWIWLGDISPNENCWTNLKTDDMDWLFDIESK